jgi:diaminopropionate ammonia-lyase
MFLRPEARVSAGAVPGLASAARAFHVRLPGYAPTPLADVPALAAELGVARVLVKDESCRIGLPAFKILGASWAIARRLADRFGLTGALSLDELRPAVATAPLVFTAATDGNHGRAVAWMAAMLGVPAEIFVPDVLNEATVGLIVSEGATVTRVAGDYDEAVRRAARHAADHGADLVQDMSWAGYQQIPGWIVEGYGTMLAEIDDHIDPDLVVVPAGVGSLAQAVVMHYRGRAHVASVEPGSANCIQRSLLAGRPVTVRTGVTAMAGLNCGTPSALAWPHLRDGLSAAVAVSEEQAAAAVGDLAAHGISSGPCGAAALAGVRRIPLGAFGLGPSSTIVLLSTEGARS